MIIIPVLVFFIYGGTWWFAFATAFYSNANNTFHKALGVFLFLFGIVVFGSIIVYISKTAIMPGLVFPSATH